MHNLHVLQGNGQWSALTSWIEVHVEPTLPSASLRPGNVSLCDSSSASLFVSVRGGAGPWRVQMMRDGELFSLVTLEARPMQLFPAIFTKQDSDGSASVELKTTLPGVYSLSRVCDMHYCNGTLSNHTFSVAFNAPPSAIITPPHRPLCTDGTTLTLPSGAAPSITLTGTPPFHVTMSLAGDCTTQPVHVRYNSAGVHSLPHLPSRGLWVVTNVSDAKGCLPDMASLPVVAGTVTVSQVPEAVLMLRSGETCGDQAADLEVRLVTGLPPWSFTLFTPSGNQTYNNITRPSFIVRAGSAGRYYLSSVSDASSCSGRVRESAVEVVRLAAVVARLRNTSESTCQGSFKNITGVVGGTPPFSIEVQRDGNFFRRLLHTGTNGTAESNFSFAVDTPGLYTLKAVTDGRYCSTQGTGQAVVKQFSLPSLLPIASPQPTYCEGDAILLPVSGIPPFRLRYAAAGENTERNITVGKCDAVIPPLQRTAASRNLDTSGAEQGGTTGTRTCMAEILQPEAAHVGLYTITGLDDARCSVVTQRSIRVSPRSTLSLHSLVDMVCGGNNAKLEIRMDGGAPPWNARVMYPDGEVRNIESEKTSAWWEVREIGVYKLMGGEGGGCPARIGGDSEGGVEVLVQHFDPPVATISGAAVKCADQPADIFVQVSGGQWPYILQLLRDGQLYRKDKPLHVTRPDGNVTVSVNDPGVYTIQSVKDARRCQGTVSGSASVSNLPRSKAGFTESAHTMCAGSSVEVSVRVSGDGGPPPWQVTVLRDDHFFSSTSVSNSTADGGSLTFATTLPGLYQLLQEGFVDSRGCTGQVLKPLRVSVAPLPTMTITPSSGAVCEGSRVKTVIRFSGEPPWSFTMVRGGDNGTVTVDDIWSRDYTLDVPAGEYVVYSLTDRVGTGSCTNSKLSLPVIVRPQPLVTLERTVCQHLCRDEVGATIVTLSKGTPPFTVQVQDQFGTVLQQAFNAAVGELRLERSKLVSHVGNAVPEVSWGVHNWTVKSVVDSNHCSRDYHVPITSSTTEVISGGVKKQTHTLESPPSDDVVRASAGQKAEIHQPSQSTRTTQKQESVKRQ